MSKPDNDSARRIWVERGRPITEGRTVLPVIGHRTGANGVRWLKVRLPGRPNNSTGWIRKARTTSLAPRRRSLGAALTVYRNGQAVQSFPAVVGAGTTPTPRGQFCVWNVGGTMGTAVSHGCVRLDTASVTWLGERIGPGVPVTIRS